MFVHDAFAGILKNPTGLHEHKVAIERALLYDVCAVIEDPVERAGCELDKALVSCTVIPNP